MPTKMACEQTVTTYFDDGTAKIKTSTWTEKVKKSEAFDSESEIITLYGDANADDMFELED